MRAYVGIILLAGLAAKASAESQPVTFATLLDEMTDLDALAEWPDPAYTCRQFSSYDRASKSPSENWFANRDRGHFVRVEKNGGRKEWVLMDAAGPGAVVRMWSANPEGTLRVYLDNQPDPVIETPMADLLGGKMAGAPEPIAGVRGKGYNLYLPIPYAHHCRITSDKGGFYYHVNYRTYEPGTRVITLKPGDLDAAADRIAQVANRLASPRETYRSRPRREDRYSGNWARPAADGRLREFHLSLEPGKTQQLPRVTGPGALYELMLEVEPEDGDVVKALRQTLISIAFEGEETVAVPLGDFFGSAPGVNAYASLPMGMTRNGRMWSHWVMPFQHDITVRFVNQGKGQLYIKGSFLCAPRSWTDRSMYFHAGWRVERDIPTRPLRDWRCLEATGRGVLVGLSWCITNPEKLWWGEGDEKIFVDGEAFPSHFGTGTEDYFGYAWGSTELFSHAYHNQPCVDGPKNFGNTSNNRWHIMDRIPFRKDLTFDMEIFHHNEECAVTVASTAYWYGRLNTSGSFEAITPEDVAMTDAQAYRSPRMRGAIEAESMELLKSAGTVGPQGNGGCSREAHLWWSQGVEIGKQIDLRLDAPRTGYYRLEIGYLMAGDFGIVQLIIDGEDIGEPIDQFSPHVKHSGPLDLGVWHLFEGENRLSMRLVGVNPDASEHVKASLDYIVLEPAAPTSRS